MEIEKTILKIENTPNIPGLVFRNFLGDEDFERMAVIIQACDRADKNENIVTAEEIRRNYSHLQRSDTDRDMVFIEVDGEAVGYGRCQWDAELTGAHLYTFFIHLMPEWRYKGIGLPVARHFIARLREIAADHPSEANKYFQSTAMSTMPWHMNLMERLEFEPVRYGLFMTRPCSQPVEVTPLPQGIEVRPVGDEDLRKVWDAQIEAFRDHWGYVPPTEEDYQGWLEWPNLSPHLWKVAWDGDEVVGMVGNFINKEENEEYHRLRGYTENISVRRPWRRQGVARGLLTRSVKMFQEMGMEETALGVDTENPNGAKQLYESVGYKEVRRFITYRKLMK